MKMLIVLLVLMVFLTGCVAVQYRHEYPSGEKLQVNYNNANLKLIGEGFEITLPDGAKLKFNKREQYPDPNSAKAIGEAIGVGAGGFFIP